MKEKICCKIINQIPLLKYSNLGIIIRIQATKYYSDNPLNIIFDVFVDDIVPTKSTFFSNINVNNNGDLILLTSLRCCIVTKIPWDYIHSSKISSNKRIHSNELINKNEKIINKTTPRIYGLFEDEFDISETNFFKNNSIKQETIEIPLLKGYCILNLLNNSSKDYFNNINDSYIVKSNWYHLDSYTVFVLINEFNKNKSPYCNETKIFVLDLLEIINQEEIKINDSNIQKIYIKNIFKFSENIGKPIDFSYGRGPDLWNILSLFVLFDNNKIKTICPVIMNRMKLPYYSYNILYSSLLEQEFLFETKNKLNTENSYDENFHKILNIIVNDLRNPVDESGNIIEDYLYIDISKDPYDLISKLYKPIPIELTINWDKFDTDIKMKSIKLSFITNYPVTVCIILNSNNNIGLFISSFLSLPYFDNNKNYIDIEEYLELICLQNMKIPLEWLNMDNNQNNIIFYDTIFDKNYSIDQNLFVIGVSINNILATIHIDWLHYLFSLYSFEKNNNHNIKEIPVSDQIESIRKYLISNQKLNIDNILILDKNINFNDYSLIFMSEYEQNMEEVIDKDILSQDKKDDKNKININKIMIEYIYPIMERNEDLEEKLLINSKYDELPILSSKELFLIKSIKKNYSIDNKIFLETKIDEKNKSTIEFQDQIDNLNKLSEIAINNSFKEFFDELRLIKNDFEKIKEKDKTIDYHLKILKLLNRYNKDIIIKLKASSKPLINLINNITPRILFLEDLQKEIKYENDEIMKKEEEINVKIQDTIKNNTLLQERITNIKHLLIQELNLYRIQYDQDVIIPELLLMLSNIQLELCWSIINLSNSNTSIVDNNNDIENMSNKLEIYMNHNKQVLKKFQLLQTNIIELNKLVEY